MGRSASRQIWVVVPVAKYGWSVSRQIWVKCMSVAKYGWSASRHIFLYGQIADVHSDEGVVRFYSSN